MIGSDKPWPCHEHMHSRFDIFYRSKVRLTGLCERPSSLPLQLPNQSSCTSHISTCTKKLTPRDSLQHKRSIATTYTSDQ